MGRITPGVLRRDAPLFSTMMVASAGERMESLSTAHPTPARAELGTGAPTAATTTSQPTNTTPTLKTYQRTKRFPSPLDSQKKNTPKATPHSKTSKNVSTKPDQHEPSSKLKKKVVKWKGSDHAGRALTTAAKPIGKAQDSENINKTPTAATPSGGPWCQETMGELNAFARQEIHSERSDESLSVGTQQRCDEDSFDLDVDIDQLCKELTETPNVPFKQSILMKSSNEPTTTGTQKLVGEDSIDTLNFDELTVSHSVPSSHLGISNDPPVVGTQQQGGEDRDDISIEELTAKVETQQQIIDSMTKTVKTLLLKLKKRSYSLKPRSRKFKGEKTKKVRRRLVKLSTPSSSSRSDGSKMEDDFKGELAKFQEEEKREKFVQGTGATNVSNVEANDRSNVEVIETTTQQMLVVPGQINVDPPVLVLTTPTSAGELTTAGQDTRTAETDFQTTANEERVISTCFTTPMNFKFSKKGSAGASTSTQTLTEEQRLAEFVERQRLDKLMEESIRIEAERTVANQDEKLLRRRSQNLTIRASLPPKKVYVEGKGKEKMLVLTKKERLMKFHLEQALARQAREIHDEDTLRAMLGDQAIEEDLMAWRIREMEKERLVQKELERKLRNEKVRIDIEMKEKERIEKELLEKEIKKELEDFFSNPPLNINEQIIKTPKVVQTRRGSKRKSTKSKLKTDQNPSKRQKMINYFTGRGLYTWEQLKEMRTDRLQNMFDVFKDKEREEQAKDEKVTKNQSKIPTESVEENDPSIETCKVSYRGKKSQIEGNKRRYSERNPGKKRKLQLAVIKEPEVLHVDPLQVDVPIVSWYMGEQGGKTVYVVKKADGSIKYYRTIPRIFQEMNRKEIGEMHAVGLKMHKNVSRYDPTIGLLLDYLRRMFEPELYKSEISKYDNVRHWELYGNSGIYYIQMSADVQYYLVEKKYNHHLDVMRVLLEKKLKNKSQSDLEQLLLLKIAGQILDIETGITRKD